jgi:hypothetical protein
VGAAATTAKVRGNRGKSSVPQKKIEPGQPKTGGRAKGARNRKTIERQERAAEIIREAAAALGPDAVEGDAHALLVRVYKNAAMLIELRVDCAKAAIGSEKPRLATIAAKCRAS